MFNKISNFLGGNKEKKEKEVDPNEELSKITLVGRFFVKKIGEPARELSDDAEVSLRIIDFTSFKYSIVVRNNNHEFDKNEWDKQVFSITNDLALKNFSQQGLTILVWELNKVFYSFTILSDPNNKTNKIPFIQNLCNFILSYDMDTPLQNVNVDEATNYLTNLGETSDVFEFLESQYSNFPEYSGKTNTSNSQNNLDKIDSRIKKEPQDYLAQEFEKKMIIEKKKEENKNEIPQFIVSFPDSEILFAKSGNLLKYDKSDDKLSLISKKCMLKVLKVSEFKFYLQADDYQYETENNTNSKNNHTVTCSLINQELSVQGNFEQQYVMWVGRNNNDVRCVYNFVFDDKKSLNLLNSIINRCWYVHNNRFEAKDDDAEYLDNMQGMEVDDDEDLGEEEEEDKGFHENQQNNDYSNFNNKHSTQAYLYDRTFVVKENNAIVVYKTDVDEDDNVLEVLNSIPPVKNYEGNNVNIDDAKMFLSDSSLLLLDKSRQMGKEEDYIYRYDLNKMKIVEEYKTDKKVKDINAFTTENRYGHMTDNQLLVGINSDSLFTLDPRINKSNKLGACREYAKTTKTLFKTLCTSANGNIVVGSVDGKIRLYSGSNIHAKTSAKTALPSLGDPIKSVEISNDGNYILATCNNYLMVINTKVSQDGKDVDGFNQSITKNCKSLKLQVSPLDIDRYNLYNFGFNPARFNVGSTLGDTNIVTSIGDYIVIWNFAKVKKGIKKDYKIKKMNQHVRNNEFMYDKNELVVTMDRNVGLQHQLK